MRALLIVLLLAACSRPLTPNEVAFAHTVHGPALDADRVRLHNGALVGGITFTRPARPQRACRERIRPRELGDVRVSTAAIALFDRVFVARPFFRRDYLADYPDTLPLEDAMLLAHELTHVWQWQQRRQTGYAPWKAAAEHAAHEDPYLFDIGGRDFPDYGWEQQGGLVEEYVCCRALDPGGDRTAALHALLAPHFPGLRTRERATAVTLRHDGIETRGICS